MKLPALMVQGCTSDAGKTTLVAALCRILHRQGVRVAPFKPQNMALNAAVTVDGGEIGRAQALQALAAGLEPHSDFNPVLLKPTTDTRAQVIIHGQVASDLDARSYHAYKPRAMQAVLESWARLTSQYDCVIVEGAGSPAEINLRDRDIANMGFAEAVDIPVVLIADIDRGGVFAHLVGTLELLSETERRRIVGFVINRFRGDIKLLESGLAWLEARTGKPVLGVLPYLQGLYLDAEDAIGDSEFAKSDIRLKVVAPAYPRMSNHNDFDPLRLHPQVDFRFVGPGEAPPPCDLIVLPGSKAVQADLSWLREQGWDAAIHRHLRYGGKLIGICGGMQMLGRSLNDPTGRDGEPGRMPGLGLLDFETTYGKKKMLARVAGHLQLPGSPACRGYEIHLGRSSGPALERPAAMLTSLSRAAAAGQRERADSAVTVESLAQPSGSCRADGALSGDGQIFATYCHGLFDHPEALRALLRWAGADDGGAAVDNPLLASLAPPEGARSALGRPGGAAAIFLEVDPPARREADLDRLADAVESAIDWSRLDWPIRPIRPPARS